MKKSHTPATKSKGIEWTDDHSVKQRNAEKRIIDDKVREAAPELLIACEKALKMLSFYSHFDDTNDMEFIKNTINKAKGF